jgi:hypothetical protein
MSNQSSNAITPEQARAALEKVQRFDLVPNYRCGSVIDEMERSADGDWVRYEDVAEALAREAAALLEPVGEDE